MATLTLVIGQRTPVSISATDGNATRIFQGLLKRHGFILEDLTDTEQEEKVLETIINFIKASATAQEADEAAQLARKEVLLNSPSWGD